MARDKLVLAYSGEMATDELGLATDAHRWTQIIQLTMTDRESIPKAAGLPVCLLLNFGKPRLEIKRLRAP